jgi:hypothetical protein
MLDLRLNRFDGVYSLYIHNLNIVLTKSMQCDIQRVSSDYDEMQWKWPKHYFSFSF